MKSSSQAPGPLPRPLTLADANQAGNPTDHHADGRLRERPGRQRTRNDAERQRGQTPGTATRERTTNGHGRTHPVNGRLAEAERCSSDLRDHATSDCATSAPTRITIEAVAGTRLSSDGSSFFTAAPLKYVCATYAASDLFWAPPWPLR